MEKKSGFNSPKAQNVVALSNYRNVELYDLTAEQVVLGAILFNNLNFEIAASYLSGEMFYSSAHARIWEEIKKKIDSAQKASPISISANLKDVEGLPNANPAEYLSGLVADLMAPDMADVDGVAKLIRDYHLRRQMLQAVEDAAESIKTNPSIFQSLQPLEIAIHKAVEVTGDKLPETKESWLSTVKFVEGTRNGEIVVQKSKIGALDEILGGFQSGCLYIVAGATGMGKTALGLNIASNVAEEGSVLVFSMEMTSSQLLMRLCAGATGIPVKKQIMATDLTDDEMRRMIAWQPNNNLRIIQNGNDLSTVANASKKFVRKFPDAKMIVVDYLQLMNGSDPKMPRVYQIEQITRGLKKLAVLLNIPIILLSQLSRSVSGREDKRPILSDLKDAGSIEQDADAVIFVYRHEYYLAREEPRPRSDEAGNGKFADRMANWQQMLEDERGKAEVIIAKNRYGETGIARMSWNGIRQQFTDLDLTRKPIQETFF